MSGSVDIGIAWKKSCISTKGMLCPADANDLRPIQVIHSPMSNRKQPLQIGSLKKASGGETTGTIAFNPFGASAAANHCVWPTYDPPHMPIFPSHHACSLTHSTVSK